MMIMRFSFLIFFMKAYIGSTHLNCIDLYILNNKQKIAVVFLQIYKLSVIRYAHTPQFGLLHLDTWGDSSVSLNFARVNSLFRFQG